MELRDAVPFLNELGLRSRGDKAFLELLEGGIETDRRLLIAEN